MSMAGLHKYFKPALPTKESTGISQAATKEANAAVEKALEEGKQPRKRKYQHFTPDWYSDQVAQELSSGSNHKILK